eukprot:TRINITY_DN321_c0_g1_i5.p1 TRINITY_DN321_c0_g1~~TRINITY_DN321_c0_g1_i5.p1  ORF type:complete len:450 (-),score=137.55 TRINITY_DN321_c0_g1_i5:167-1516(-)
MSSSASTIGCAVLGAAAMGAMSTTFTVAPSTSPGSASTAAQGVSPQFLAAATGSQNPSPGTGLSLGAGALAVASLAAASGSRRSRRSNANASAPALVPVGLGCSVSSPSAETYFRDELVARRAELSEAGAPSPEETDSHMQALEDFAKKTVAGAAAIMVFAGSCESAVAYPIFAQQNYKEPRALSGKIACANCHLAQKEIDVRMPHDVLADTIFKVQWEIPLKYEKRVQPVADGSKGPLNVGAIAIMPEGFKLAPKDRLPKPLKKEMKGLAWSAYSKEQPNILVAGPVPGSSYGEKMVMPVLAPDPNTQKGQEFGKKIMYFGGNRGRGQVYPEGNQSNNNQFTAAASGKITAIDGLKVSITKADGEVEVQELLPGANIVVQVGDTVKKDEPITTNPNVGGFGQAEKDFVLQDMNRVYGYCAMATSIFIAQLSFVLKKKQFEKVQLAEGF